MTIHLSVASRVTAFCCGWWLIATGLADVQSQSKGAENWQDETSFAALQLRSQGRTNAGLGFLAMSSSLIGLKINLNKDDDANP